MPALPPVTQPFDGSGPAPAAPVREAPYVWAPGEARTPWQRHPPSGLSAPRGSVPKAQVQVHAGASPRRAAFVQVKGLRSFARGRHAQVSTRTPGPRHGPGPGQGQDEHALTPAVEVTESQLPTRDNELPGDYFNSHYFNLKLAHTRGRQRTRNLPNGPEMTPLNPLTAH